MYFFRDELEKQAFFTPPTALKAMNYAEPGFLGNMVRGAGRAGARVQQAFAPGTAAAEAIEAIGKGAYLGENVALGTLKGYLGRAAVNKVPVPKNKVIDNIKDGLTWEGRNSPLERTYNPFDLGNVIPTPSF
jgi:hypothetical protein